MACETATVRYGSKAVGLVVTATAAQARAGKVAGAVEAIRGSWDPELWKACRWSEVKWT